MQLFLAAAGIFQFCWMYACFPETAQPGTRGIDDLPGIVGVKHHPKVIFINPLRPLALLRSPNLLFIVSCYYFMCHRNPLTLFKSLIASSSLMNFFCTSFIMFSHFVEIHEYGNSAFGPIALHYREHILYTTSHPKSKLISSGHSLRNTQRNLGRCLFHTIRPWKHEYVYTILSYETYSFLIYYSLVGAPIAGIISDRTVIWWRNKRKGTWYPEDRLRASLIPLALMVPLPVIAFGLINKFVDGSVGLFTSLLCLFINGIGVSIFFIHHGTRSKHSFD